MNKFVISAIRSREVIDNRGTPTIRAYVCVGDEFWGQADVPCGSSTGTYEAKELRDGDSRYRGKGVRKAIRNIQEIIYPRLPSRYFCNNNVSNITFPQQLIEIVEIFIDKFVVFASIRRELTA